MTAEQINVNARLAQILVAGGAKHVFGVVGSGNFDLTNQLINQGVAYTAARHEGGAATMADAFTRSSPAGEFAVLSVHQGCGLTNAITGIGEAAKSGTGMLVLAADTAEESAATNFEIDQDSLAQAVGATALRIDDADHVALVAHEALEALRRGKTVVLSVPIDVQNEVVREELTPETPAPRTGTVPQTSQVVRAAKSLARAQRPVILAGRGAIKAKKELEELAEISGALLATSAVAHGLFTDNPWSLGISGGFSSPTTTELISNADLIISFGSALNNWTTAHGQLINPEATLIQVDHSPEAIGKYRAVSQTLIADSAAVAQAMIIELPQHIDPAEPLTEGNRTGYRTEESAQLIANRDWNDQPLPGGDISDDERIDPRLMSVELDHLVPTERVVATDSGNFMGYPAAYLRVPDHYGFVFTQAFQAIGLGLATITGASIAQPHRLPVLGTGDGGMLMGISELETLVRLRIPAVIIVYNDAAYGAEVHHFGSAEESQESPNMSTVTFPDTDFAALAQGYGAQGMTVRSIADLGQVREWLSTVERISTETEDELSGVPLVIDAKIASDGGAWWLHHAFEASQNS